MQMITFGNTNIADAFDYGLWWNEVDERSLICVSLQRKIKSIIISSSWIAAASHMPFEWLSIKNGTKIRIDYKKEFK